MSVEAAELSSTDSFADRVVDELLPEDLEWRRLVTSYPKTVLATVAVAGYLLGRSRGAVIVGALAEHASETVSRNVNTLIGEDVI